MGRSRIYALRLILRFYGWQSSEMEEEEQLDGARAGFSGRLGKLFDRLCQAGLY